MLNYTLTIRQLYGRSVIQSQFALQQPLIAKYISDSLSYSSFFCIDPFCFPIDFKLGHAGYDTHLYGTTRGPLGDLYGTTRGPLGDLWYN